MKICNCTLPTIHGADVCKNCANYNEYQLSDQFSENVAMIDRYFENITKTELLDDLKSAGMKIGDNCKVCNSGSEFVKLYAEISATICDKVLVISQYSPLYMESDIVEIEINYCPMCGRKL